MTASADAHDRLLEDPRAAGCPVERTLGVLDGKWTTLVIRELLSGPKRFTELRRALAHGGEGRPSIPSPSPKTLTERLRILEHQGILSRTVYAEVPPRVEYALTPRGESLRSVLDAMWEWGSADAGRPFPG